ncbi:MAG TPA: hypothetical protein VHZ04_01435 [Candidatus Paceibacterota bacterium]|jgi:hypothetical protein|nr:hypothetical protein [Candidatus Paceibacterota bacterium]
MNQETTGQPTEGTNGTGRLRHERKPIEHIYDLSGDEWVGMFPDGHTFIHDSDPQILVPEEMEYGLHVARQRYFVMGLREEANRRCA